MGGLLLIAGGELGSSHMPYEQLMGSSTILACIESLA